MYGTNHGAIDGQSSHFALGLLCGAAVGAAVGILLAPKSGAELRSQLATSAGRLRKTVDDGYQHASDMVEQVVEDGREAVRRGREAFEQTRTDFGREPLSGQSNY
jgi:gas vesicle protein